MRPVLLLCVFACLVAQNRLQADAPATHIAVIADADSKDLAALVTTELSTVPDLALVERDELAKLGDEAKLQQLAGSDAVALGKLAGADGLLFLDKRTDGLHVRYTAVHLGYVLFDNPVSADVDPAQEAKIIAHLVLGDFAKLKLDPAKAIPISVLNLRADYATSNSAQIERNLTLLLESRLASVPEYVVLERRHAWSLGFEHSVSTPSSPLLEGNYVVDGTLSLPGQKEGEMTVHLRLRLPNKQEMPIEIQGTENDLPGLVEKVVGEIRKSTGGEANTSAWQPQTEAREFLQEGIWAYRRGLGGPALEALESAELLGEKAPDLLAVRIPVLCIRAVGSRQAISDNVPIPDDPNPDDRIAWLQRAMADQSRYQSEQMESKLEILDHFHTADGRTGDLHDMVDQSASRVLAMLDHEQSPKAEELRSALRSFAHYNPLQGQMPGDWKTAINFADNWSASLEEEKAYYRLLSTTNPWAAYGGWMLRWRLTPDNFCVRFLTTPEERRAGYLNFFQSLTSDPVARPAALLYLAMWADPSQKDAACHALYDDLWEEHETLFKANRLVYLLKYSFDLEKGRKVPVADPKLIAVLHYDLQNETKMVDATLGIWCPDLFPPAEAPALWHDLQAFEKKVGGGGYSVSMNQLFTDRFGDPDATKTPVVPLVVSQFWYPKDGTTGLLLGTHGLVPSPDGVWVSGTYSSRSSTHPALYHVALDPGRADPFLPGACIEPPMIRPQDMVLTHDAIYMLGPTQDGPRKTMVERYDLTSQEWSGHETPEAERIFAAADQVYLGLVGDNPAQREGGIARYNGKTGEMILLASSRRRPAQNQFDDRTSYFVYDVYTGPNGKPCATIDMDNYYISDQPGPWIPLTQAGLLMHTRTEGDRTLLFGSGSYGNKCDAAVMADPAKADPELWLGPLTPLQKTNSPGSEKLPPPALPSWANQSIWQQPEGFDSRSVDYGFRGNDLFGLVTSGQKVKKVKLAWYRRGERTPVCIPLSFEMNNAVVDALKAVLQVDPKTFQMVQEPNKTPYILSMTVVPQGICFKAIYQGFWFLPFSEIDDYLKAHSVKPSSTGTGTSVSTPQKGTGR